MLPDQLRKAEIAMLKISMRALQLGAVVSKPVFEGSRYDYIIEKEGLLFRVQVKYADGKHHRTPGAVYVNLRKEIRKDRNHPYNETEIDALLVYIPKIDQICWFGPDIFSGKQNLSVRITPAKNGQIKRCIAAEDFLW